VATWRWFRQFPPPREEQFKPARERLPIDWFPTLLQLAGAKPPPNQPLDGVSLLPLFTGAADLNRPRLFWHFPCYVGRATPSSAMREGNFKLIEFFEDGGRQELYDLSRDPGEQLDLSATMPEKAASLGRTLRAWQVECKALMPQASNPRYDPRAERPRGKTLDSADAAKKGKKGK